MKYYIIAGEASGDLHGSNLVAAIKARDANAQFRGFGGDKMKSEGVTLFRHYKETAYMGFIEVVMHLRSILKNIEQCKKDMLAYKPDAIILVDYPGFNLRIAPFAKENGLKVFYYISPQLWAWKSSRVEIIKKYVDHMFVILPFEQAWYQQHDYQVTYVGHPLLDEISNKVKNSLFYKVNNLSAEPIIGVLPGSRKQEIAVKLPVMLSMAKYYPKFQFVVACAPGIEKSYYEQFVREQNVFYLFNQTYDILQNSEAALVTSGTATLETALFN
ncbi:MAG: lipid-A-disaccharide synthase, partial [Chitinophagales bacterium]